METFSGKSSVKLKFDKLNNDNYGMWSKLAMHALKQARCWYGVIETDDPVQLAADIAADRDGELARRNETAYSAILTHVTAEVFPIVESTESAYVAWTELQNMFGAVIRSLLPSRSCMHAGNIKSTRAQRQQAGRTPNRSYLLAAPRTRKALPIGGSGAGGASQACKSVPAQSPWHIRLYSTGSGQCSPSVHDQCSLSLQLLCRGFVRQKVSDIWVWFPRCVSVADSELHVTIISTFRLNLFRRIALPCAPHV